MKRALAILVAVSAAVSLAACGGERPAAPGLVALYGRVLAAERFVAAPDRRWEVAGAGSERVWRFGAFASISCWIGAAPTKPIAFFLAATPETSGDTFAFLWDEVPLVDRPLHVPHGGLEIPLPADRLTPGRHRLTVRRVARRVSGAPGSPEFVALGLKRGEVLEPFAPGRAAEHGYLSDFLEFGSTGLRNEKQMGVLALGPRELETTVTATSGAKLYLRPENASAAPARFAVSAGGRREEILVPPSARGWLELPLREGSSDLVLRVEGDADGLFLWGLPRVKGGESRRRDEPRPAGPIVLISLDTTRRDALSPYGGRAELTPNIERFARTATVFENAHASAPWTLPSHASMFTGLYPTEHGLGVSRERFGATLTPLAERLAEAGYLTAGLVAGNLCAYRYGLAQGFHLYRDPDRGGTTGERLTDRAESFLVRHHDEPFFLFLNYFDPHGPFWGAPERFAALVDVAGHEERVRSLPVWGAYARRNPRAWSQIVYGEASLVPEGTAYLRSQYLAQVAFMDEQVGRLLESLARLGLYEPALILMVADHGEALGERDFVTHGVRLDRVITEIPLLVKWPGQAEGRRVEDLVSVVDLFPTILRHAGLAADGGRGLALTRDGLAEPEKRRYLLLEEHASFLHPIGRPQKIADHLYGIQERDERRILWRGGQECARAPEWRPEPCPEPWEAGLERVVGLLAGSGAGAAEGAQAEVGEEALSAAEREKLRALGYLQ